ncbi:hypothetical protein [Desulfonatronovibrio magnus]|uniref:hypothetical protein n=1 Tax=Desulfonatronovibrio magnus TaxID=698827 RepID=UPI0005EBAE4D|nr:hypothetical protein [Desulfonatronovibrio magnus]RQD62535.1 MAG: hypothetical protein D5R98_05955 [Desulfonatronovibrio sp. MSAO_Bac4]
MNRLLWVWIFSGLFFFIVSPVMAQTFKSDPDRISLKAETQYRFKSGIKNSRTDVSSTRYNISGSYSYFTLAYEHTHYSWDHANRSEISDADSTPWTGLHQVTLSGRKSFFLSRQWMINAGFSSYSAFEKELSKSFGGSADVSFIRIFPNGWSAGVGAVGLYHPVRSFFLPGIQVSYAPTGESGFSARLGLPRSQVRYGFNEKIAAQAYGSLASRVYRLKDNSPVSSKGYYWDRSIKLGLEMELKPLEQMTINFGPYILVDRKWKLYTRSGKRISTEKLDNTPGVRASVNWRF